MCRGLAFEAFYLNGILAIQIYIRLAPEQPEMACMSAPTLFYRLSRWPGHRKHLFYTHSDSAAFDIVKIDAIAVQDR